MKKLIISGVAGAAILGGVLFSLGDKEASVQEKKPVEKIEKVETKKEEVESTPVESEPKEVVKVNHPTERTVSIQGMPWDVYKGTDLIDKVNKAEIVYLFDDWDQLDIKLRQLASDKNDKDWWHTQVMLYQANLQEFYPDKVTFFEKLKEIQNAITAENYEALPSLLDETKKLKNE
ncbi:hypothetical protein [Mesobacillus foraminis]|uniref:Uncharacterized protein n=1 Tax=Mesobacillus foraminis TaxID=279826 RepID=A0A4R2BGH0_9BACI|nr:hypothetical protein [Mesobacillus foraminis]TCN25472.1 hypothetical protein EV146_105129 [Mesobacillus foraminis]